MKTRKHIHEETLPVSPERVFALLHTPSAIRSWWQAARAIVLPEAGGLWCATWGDAEDDPDYITAATIEVFEPPRRMVLSDYRYFAKSGPQPFEADFTLEFLITAHPDGAILKVTQDGFPIAPVADAFYAACEKGWADTFEGIRKFVHDKSSIQI